ncbi:MAG: glycosyl transferase family 2 [Acidimicrobiales bacterium]|nr:glycosyl transferase family 2 [Acidimicrobiales bacterium]
MPDAPAPVTVLVPVYRGAPDVARCLDSVRRHASAANGPVDVLVIDDASPEAEVVDLLRGIDPASWPVPITVLRNERNVGFVATVNRGLRHARHDVVVLNADTVVTAGWLDRMRAVAASAPDVATVTPLSGFGSICTLPVAVRERFGLAGDDPEVDACAAFVLAHSLQLAPEVITGVGFCMYVTRAAVELVGPLDEATFGTGYGEEVDFCLRASRLGLRHLVDDATFVHHRGGASFGQEERRARMAASSALLHRRYPFFRAANRAERDADPLAVPFAALELGLAERVAGRPHVLHVLHSPPEMPGGTEQHVMALIDALLDDIDASILYHVDSGFVLRTIWRRDGERDEHEYLFPGAHRKVTKVFDEVAGEALATVLELFAFDAVHLQNLVGHSLAPLAALRGFPGPVVCSVRDLYLACPHHWLLTPDLQPCGIPDDLDVCARCLPQTRGLSRADLEGFRAIVADHLDVIDRWVFASQSACDYLLRAYDIPDEKVEVIAHGALIPVDRRVQDVDDALIATEPLRLAFVGVGWPKKGLDVVNRVADALVGSGVEVHHFGKLRAPASSALRTHGPYDNAMLPDLLVAAGVQVALLPVPYAETFGHVMTEVLVAGLPVIGTSYGALGERIRQAGVGWTVDPGDVDGIVALIHRLDLGRAEVRRATEQVRRLPLRTVAETAPSYADLYLSHPVGRPRRTEGAPVSDDDRRLRRHLRALASVNRQLHAQVADLQARAGETPANLRRARSAPPADPRPAPAAHETEAPAMDQPAADQPYLTRRSDGVVFMIDVAGRRKVKSGLVAAALEEEFGPPRAEGEQSFERSEKAPAMDVLVSPDGYPFVIVGGKRLPLKGLPVPRPATAAELDRFPEGKTLDVGRANVARSRVGASSAGTDLASQVKRVARGVKRRLAARRV